MLFITSGFSFFGASEAAVLDFSNERCAEAATVCCWVDFELEAMVDSSFLA